MTVIQNNLIAQAVATTKSAENNKPAINTKVKPDTFENSTKEKTQTTKSSKILNPIVSTLFFIALFFVPDMISAFRNKKSLKLIEGLRNFKPLIGEENLTNVTQKRISGNRIKTCYEKVQGKFKYIETVILDSKSKITNRIFVKKEEMPNGKLITRKMKAYKGTHLIDNDEILNNESKYLVKEFSKTPVRNKEYSTTIKRKGQNPEFNQYYSTSNGEPVLRVKETATNKENTTFLYKNDTLVGTDRQIIPKDKSKKIHNILTIPNAGIKHKEYDLQTDGPQYDNNLIEKLLRNY